MDACWIHFITLQSSGRMPWTSTPLRPYPRLVDPWPRRPCGRCGAGLAPSRRRAALIAPVRGGDIGSWSQGASTRMRASQSRALSLPDVRGTSSGIQVRVVGAVHSSTRSPTDRPGGVACGYSCWRIRRASGCTMRETPSSPCRHGHSSEGFGRPMWPSFPSGARSPWGGQRCAGRHGHVAIADTVVGMHYDTFPPIAIDQGVRCPDRY